jgi:hypothetical protein
MDQLPIDTAWATPRLAHDATLSEQSRVWVYVTDRPLTADEAQRVQVACDDFVRQWTAHNSQLTARAEVFAHNFLILLVDETRAGASGCSIDKSVHFLEKLGAELGIDFFERMRFGWVEDGQICVTNRAEFGDLVRNGGISSDMPVLNTLAQTRGDLAHRWLVPFGQSWHKKLV